MARRMEDIWMLTRPSPSKSSSAVGSQLNADEVGEGSYIFLANLKN